MTESVNKRWSSSFYCIYIQSLLLYIDLDTVTFIVYIQSLLLYIYTVTWYWREDKKNIWIREGKINTCIIFFLFHSWLIEISHAAVKASAATWFKHAISCLSLNSLSNERSIPYLSSRVRKYNSWNWLTYRWPLGVAGSINLNTLLLSGGNHRKCNG